MGKVIWNASGGGTQSMSPGDHPVHDGQASMTDARFGGHREYSQVADAKDYTGRTPTNVTKKENPVDDVVKDVDDMTNSAEKKREFSYQEEKINVQKGNDVIAIQTDPENRPRMGEGSDAVQVPEVVEERVRKKANKWQYDTSDTYEGEIS